MIRAVIFDYDGIIVDTERKRFKDIQQILKKDNYSISKSDFNNFIGKKTSHFLKEKFPHLDEKKIIAYSIKRRVKEFKEANEIKLIPGIISLIKYLHSKKYLLAITSGSKKRLIKKVLNIKKIFTYFDMIIDGNDFSSSKPNPECYNITLKKLNLGKKDVIIIEDSLAGILSAKRAKCKVFGIATYLEEQNMKNANKTFKNHSDLLKYLKKNKL